MIYKIGDLARDFGVTLRTLRFYEDRGLITPTRSGTTRLYSERDRERLRLTLFCKRIGLSLGEIREVLELQEHDDGGSNSARLFTVYEGQLKALEQQRRDTERAIADLQQAMQTMQVN